VNLDDPTCVQNFEVTIQVVYALIWEIFKRGFELEFQTQSWFIIQNTVYIWWEYYWGTLAATMTLGESQLQPAATTEPILEHVLVMQAQMLQTMQQTMAHMQ
jgi:hypothetical protein